jgi:acyl-CoA dehydrogenase
VSALASLRTGDPDPAAESEVLGRWLLARGGIAPPGEGRVTVAPGSADDRVALDGGRLSGTACRVPWARDAELIVILVDGRLLAVRREEATIEHGSNLAGEPRDTASFDSAAAQVGGACDPGAVRARGALVRALLMAGTLERVSELTIAHAGERRQFGRPIGSFQAVQQHVVAVAQAAALVGVAADAAARRPDGFEISTAKLLANRAAVSAARAAHQVHGARGTTREHPLSELTRRLWSWRSEHGDERYWSERLGAAIVRAGADRLYPAITGGSAVLEV